MAHPLGLSFQRVRQLALLPSAPKHSIPTEHPIRMRVLSERSESKHLSNLLDLNDLYLCSTNSTNYGNNILDSVTGRVQDGPCK